MCAYPLPVTPVDDATWTAWLREQQAAVSRIIDDHVTALADSDPGHSRLREAVCYSLTQGGKRLRPILVRAACEACGQDPALATPGAIAIECIHTFSLIHDDLPAMDDDDLRRGQPTSHRVFGEAAAILAGDWLVTHAFAVLARADLPGAVTAELAAALAGGTLGMIEGQAADIAGEHLPPEATLVDFIHRHKTGRLIEASCRLGALCSGAGDAQLTALSDYGRHLGLAFQIVDDVLDCTSSTEQLGKRAGKDAGESKQTYPAVHGIEESRRRARQAADDAIAALTPFGERARWLGGLARYVVSRDR